MLLDNCGLFPMCFSEAQFKLRKKFRNVNRAMIEDGIQYACIEYWVQNIANRIPNDKEALGWFLTTARNYLLKEIKFSNRHTDLSEAKAQYSTLDIANCIDCRDFLNSLDKTISSKNASILIKHGMGYSLKEIGIEEGISESAAKQRHSRGLRKLRIFMQGDS
jgi:DNA-directed RNA polymerase specialized sigma24 family protein